MGLDPTVTNVRVFPLLEVSRSELAEIVGGEIASVDLVDGGLTNTIHKVTLDSGAVFGVKHYAGGREWFDTELSTLTLLHGTIPVPDVVHVDDQKLAIVYRWIDGITLHELRKGGDVDGFASLAEPLGRVLAWLARTDATEPYELTQILERAYGQLSNGRARTRLGADYADALKKALEVWEPRLAWGTVCLAHGDLGHRNVIVQRRGARWRVGGLIDWETTTTGSPLFDIGSLFRYANRHDVGFREAFARGYDEAASAPLPDDWLLAARLLDSTWLVDLLDDVDEIPVVFEDCHRQLVRLVDELG
ncbi:MAG TPA: aminoglycoside phosphotransferase family protein [Kofleriaceae bacterium]